MYVYDEPRKEHLLLEYDALVIAALHAASILMWNGIISYREYNFFPA